MGFWLYQFLIIAYLFTLVAMSTAGDFLRRGFMGGVIMKYSNLDALFWQVCHMNTDTNRYKFSFINIGNRTMFLRQETEKQVFQKRLGFKAIADVWWPPICLSRFLQGTSIDCVWELKWSKSFKWFSTVVLCIWLSGWCIRKGCSEGSP